MSATTELTNFRSPYSGELLISHLGAYGLMAVLEDAGISARLNHDRNSQSFEPTITFRSDRATAVTAIRSSAARLEELVERDIEPGLTGNNRRSVIWARGTYANDPDKAQRVLSMRGELVEQYRDDPLALGLLAGLGAPATWLPTHYKPSNGATRLDGVLGNHTSDLVRGVLRFGRAAAMEIDDDYLGLGLPDDPQKDKTGWAPTETLVDLPFQWLAVLGLGMLPVAHRANGSPSSTPACWRDRNTRGVTLPILRHAVAPLRLRAILGQEALRTIGTHPDDNPTAIEAAKAQLGSLDVREVVSFRQVDRGSSSAVAFNFTRGTRIDLR